MQDSNRTFLHYYFLPYSMTHSTHSFRTPCFCYVLILHSSCTHFVNTYVHYFVLNCSFPLFDHVNICGFVFCFLFFIFYFPFGFIFTATWFWFFTSLHYILFSSLEYNMIMSCNFPPVNMSINSLIQMFYEFTTYYTTFLLPLIYYFIIYYAPNYLF